MAPVRRLERSDLQVAQLEGKTFPITWGAGGKNSKGTATVPA
jgi:hypothetical protein